jgi:N-acetylglucosamine-6-phosphate deacetylase
MHILLTSHSLSDGLAFDGLALAVSDGRIAAVGEADEVRRAYPDAPCTDLRRFTVLPGLIDIHVHGGNGFDTMDGTYEAINGISRYKILEGVTSFMPSTVTAGDALTAQAANGVNEALEKGTDGARVLGIFFEGPYINPANKGAHPQAFIRAIDLPEMQKLTKLAKNESVVSLAVAPEQDGAADAIKALCEAGVNVRLGHSSATLSQAELAMKNGANIAIHTYNAMSALNHREPGMVGAAMTLDGFYAEIICDLVHVHPSAVRVLAKARGAAHTVLVTDCMSAGGLPDGDYRLGELPVYVRGGVCRLSQDPAEGTLAGSTARLIDCVKNMHQTVGIPLAEAVQMATATPAKAIGVYEQIGSLTAGKQADIIAIDEHFTIKFVMAGGAVKLNA